MLIAYEQLILQGVDGLRRSGDDLFLGDGKLSVSIATVSRVSCLIHVGINIVNEGTPVETACLTQAGVDPVSFGRDCAVAFARELTEMCAATTKVRGV